MVNRPLIPDDVRRFILTAVPSVPYLEALLLLRGSDADGVDATTLAAGLYLSEKAAAALLAQLRSAGVAEQLPCAPGTVRYAPVPTLAALIERLATVYADNLIGVSMLIHSTSASAARAEAFRIQNDV